ncbi:MAG: class B sortase [Eubacterium sp.]|nr:class B sortase [Eubacterium sp.]
MKTTASVFILAALVLFISNCAFYLIARMLDYARDRIYYGKVREEANAADYYALNSEAVTIDWEAFRGTDIVAWIVLDDRINYPVMQTKNNVFYLHHRPDKAYSTGGSIFLQAENDPRFRDRNSILYGHHMFDGSMFDHLMDYKDESYKDHHLVLFLPDGTRRTYRLFSACSVDWSPAYYQYDFADQEDFMDYQKLLKKNALYETDAVPSAGSRLVTLSTCDGARGTRHRMLLTFQYEGKSKNQDAASWYAKNQDAASWYAMPDG